MLLWDDGKSKVEAAHIQTAFDTVAIKFLITTGKFSGRHTFFVQSTEINKYINTLKGMYSDLTGEIDIRDNESDSFIVLGQNGDEWLLTGQLGRSWEHNIMMFRILVDQTVIQLLLDFLQNIEAE